MSAKAPPAGLASKDFLSIPDLSHAELEHVLSLSASLKRERAARRAGAKPLAGRHVAFLFEKPSLRTRTTFMVAVRELGGDVVELPATAAFGGREKIDDVARNLERWVAGVVVRTFEHARLAEFAAAAPQLHVVNALTNEEHPCQALADMQTLQERLGSVKGRTLAYVGDGNNVAVSLAHAAAMLGLHFRIASPDGFALPAGVRDRCAQLARHGATLTLTEDPAGAVRGADAVYTDVWASMGQESEADARARVPGLPRGHRADERRRAARAVHALSARAPRRRSDRSGHGFAGLRGLRSGRKPPAHAESAAVAAAPCLI